jgi:hypothetical protein
VVVQGFLFPTCPCNGYDLQPSSSSSSSSRYMASSLPILLTLSSLSTLSAAYTWKFDSPPQQCSNLTVSLEGSGGVPPYRLLVLPNGPTPLSSGLEVRRILDVPFPAGSTSVSFQLKYPSFSQLVAVVSITHYSNFISYFLHFTFSFLLCFGVSFSRSCLSTLGFSAEWPMHWGRSPLDSMFTPSFDGKKLFAPCSTLHDSDIPCLVAT